MRQIRIPASFDLDDLVPSDVEPPPPPAQGEVLVQMAAVALNFRDVMVATGHDRWRPPVGRVPGSDGVGRVERIGKGVTRFAVGDTVLTTILPNWVSGPLTEEKRQGGLGGPGKDGVLSELVLLDADGLVHAPQYLKPVQAATLPTAGLTAWHALTRADVLRPNATILTEGTGGVSLFALQLAVAAGATVIATSSTPEKLAKLHTLGATAGVNYREQPAWAEAVVALTSGKGVDLAIDIGGASSLNESIRATAMNGAVSVVGLVGGLDATINLAEIFQKNLRLDGIETGSRAMLEAMIAWIEQKRIHPVVDRVFSFDESSAAFRYLQSGKHIGKVCIAF
jgi:NADPH:quinone reductase-like Zn-dependent oxidoreductase